MAKRQVHHVDINKVLNSARMENETLVRFCVEQMDAVEKLVGSPRSEWGEEKMRLYLRLVVFGCRLNWNNMVTVISKELAEIADMQDNLKAENS